MFHTIIFVGNLGRDPEMRYTPTGQPVTSFSVAVNDNYTSSTGEQVKRTIWFRVSVWGKQAEIANQYLKKGSKVLVEGRLVADATTGSPRLWNRQDGTVGASFEVSARTIRFLTPRAEAESLETMADLEEIDSGSEEDIPF